MTKKLWLLLAAVATVFLLFILGNSAGAWTSFRTGNSAYVGKSENIDSSLWVGAKNIDIAGTVNGDLFCAGQTVNISGSVKGDIICVGQTINISGNVDGNIRLAAQTVNMTGNVVRNASIAAQTINFDTRSQVAGDANLAGSDLNLSGNIGRDLAVAGAALDLNGQVGRDLKANIEQITLTKDAKVGGSLDYTSKNKISFAGSNQVGGTVTQHHPRVNKGHIASPLLFFGVFSVAMIFMLIVSALVITALLPVFVHRVSEQGIMRPWKALLTGLVASLAMPFVIILLMVTVVGIPIAILLGLAWLLINLSSGLFSAFWLGRVVWRGQRNALWIVMAGSLILIILYLIPVVGIIALVLATWLGEGMLILDLYSRTPRPHYQFR